MRVETTAATLVLLLVSTIRAAPQEPNQPEPPKFEPVFTDDFSTDTRSDYQLTGDVSWHSGRLTLEQGAAVERAINGGPRVRMELGLDIPAVTVDRPLAELRVWFVLEDQTDCFVRLRREFKDEKVAGSMALVDTGEQDGKLVELVVREIDAEITDLTQVTIEYRYGFVSVRTHTGVLFRAAINNGAARVTATRTEATAARLELRRLRALTTPHPLREFTATQLEQLAEAASLNRELIRLAGEGKYSEAARIGVHVLQIRGSVLGEQHIDYARILNNLAELYLDMGDYARAKTLYEQALKIRQTILGKEHPTCAASLNGLAMVCTRMRDLAHAESLYKQAIEIRQSVLGEQHPSYANSLNNLAVLYEDTGDYARAERLYKQTIEINKAALGEQDPDYATSLNNLAGLYNRTGKFANAEPLYKQALDIRRSVLGEQHPAFASSLNNLAGLYDKMGDYARAEPLCRQAIEIQKSVLGEQHPEYATSLNNLAGLYSSMADYARAEPLYVQSLNIRKSVLGEKHPTYAASLNNLAMLYRRMRDYNRAEPLYKQAIEIDKSAFGAEHPRFVAGLNNLAVLYRTMGEFARARPLFEQVVGIWKSVLGERHPEYATSLNNLAAVHKSMGNHALAEPLYKQALDIRKSVLGEQHPNYAVSLHNLASLYENMGDYSRAEQYNRDAVKVVRAVLDGSAPIQSERQQKRHQSSRRFFLDHKLSIALEGNLSAVEALEALWRWKGAVTLRQSAYRRLAREPEFAPLFADLQSVARQLSSTAQQLPTPPARSAPDSQHELYTRESQDWQKQFARLTRRREDLEQRLAAASHEYRNIQEPLTHSRVQSQLAKDTAFIDFLEYYHSQPDAQRPGQTIYERRYLAFIVRKDRQPTLVNLGAARTIRQAIDTFRQQLLRSTNPAGTDRVGVRLRNSLWLPLEEHLDGIQTIIISPDTALGTLPFAALPGSRTGTYLVEKYHFICLPIAVMLRSLFEDEPARATPQGLLAIGDVDYGGKPSTADTGANSEPDTTSLRTSTRRGHWRMLPAARDELTSVARTFRKTFSEADVTMLNAAAATEEAFVEQAPRHAHLHLVTHGFFARPESSELARSVDIDQLAPGLLSGIVLAGANSPPSADNSDSDGILRASEIAALNLSAVDLVVLSACDTGLGRTAGGEGLTGLQRAFHVAGASSVVASLWEVDDRITKEFMSRFYRYHWEEGLSKSDSLRKAQLDILNYRNLTRGLAASSPTRGEPIVRDKPAVAADSKPTDERTHPRYWAAFVLSGDWR